MSRAGPLLSDPLAFATQLPPASQRATANALLLIEPVGFFLSDETASDNAYMDLSRRVDPQRALAQHRVLAAAIAEHTHLPLRIFAGDPTTPDAVFCNNVFASVAGRLIVGAMRHPQRKHESWRQDIIDLLRNEGRELHRIDSQPGALAELTGPLVIDRARAIGFHGLSERCNQAGAQAMHEAFGLTRSLVFPLGAGEYHSNVVLAVLAGRAAVVYEPAVGARIGAALDKLYGPHVLRIDEAEKNAFVANCIALTPEQCWMSAGAERALSPKTRAGLRAAGFTLYTVEIDEIEKAGGSLRCCVAELF